MGPVRLPVDWVSLSSPQLEKRRTVVGKPTTPEGLVLEAWSQGFMVGSIIMLAFITMANMRKGVLLHKVRIKLLPPGLQWADINLQLVLLEVHHHERNLRLQNLIADSFSWVSGTASGSSFRHQRTPGGFLLAPSFSMCPTYCTTL